MKLSDYEMLPGIVIDADDPYSIGRVKANVPTLFYEGNGVPKEVLPWIYPWQSSGYQRFSRLEKGCKIRVLFNRDNPEEYWYIPMVDMNDQCRNAALTDDDKRGNEVLLCRTSGANTMIKYNDEDGLNMNCGEAQINVHNTKGIEVKNDTLGMTVSGNNIVLSRFSNPDNPDEKWDHETDKKHIQYALMGENVQKLLNEIGNRLMNLSNLVAGNYLTADLAPSIAYLGQYIIDETQGEKLLSETVKISK